MVKVGWSGLNRYVYGLRQGILDQFNPSLKNFVAMGKHYEKALTGQLGVRSRFTEKKRDPLNVCPLFRSNRGC